MSHTPGPWHYDQPSAAIVAQGVTVATVAACTGYGEHDDSGRLIAAAPDLLSALQNIENDLRSYGHGEPSGGTLDTIARIARAAIAKATP
jgi:hypothetical protein